VITRRLLPTPSRLKVMLRQSTRPIVVDLMTAKKKLFLLYFSNSRLEFWSASIVPHFVMEYWAFCSTKLAGCPSESS
jgi:hypothetical protein